MSTLSDKPKRIQVNFPIFLGPPFSLKMWPMVGCTENKREKSRVALITGGATRVGRCLTLAFAQRGIRTAIHYHSSRAEAQELSKRLDEMGLEHGLIPGDLTELGTPAAIVTQTVSLFGRLDILVNNAAILIPDDGETLALAKMKTLNIDAIRRCIEAASDLLQESAGSIVNIADVAGITPFPRHRAYSSTQSALIDLTRKTALELAPHNVRVNAICPGTVLPPAHYSKEAVAKLVSQIPLGRIGTPEDVAEAALYLANAAYVTGQILAVDGGHSTVKGGHY